MWLCRGYCLFHRGQTDIYLLSFISHFSSLIQYSSFFLIITTPSEDDYYIPPDEGELKAKMLKFITKFFGGFSEYVPNCSLHWVKSCIEKGAWTCIVPPSPSGTSLKGQILSKDDLSFCRGQSLLPDYNPMGEGTYGGGAEETVSDILSGLVTFRPGLVTSGLVWTSFPCDLSARAEGVKRRSRGSSASDLAKRTLKEPLSKSSSLHFLFFSESW